MKRENLIKAFERIMPKNTKTKLDKQIVNNRQQAINYLKSLDVNILSKNEIDKAFELDDVAI